MKYKKFKDINLSKLGMGAMRLPLLDNGEIDYQKGQEIIDYCYENGINYYDTAYIYHNGESEVFLGEALKNYDRDSFYIADKFKYSSNPDYRIVFEEQLGRLKMERIDFYLLHGIADNNIDDYLNCGCIEYFQRLKAKGKISYFGFSFHGKPEVLKRMLNLYKWDFVQIQLNYYDWYYGTAREQYELLEQHHIPIMVMEPVHGGMLAKLNNNCHSLLKNFKNVSDASWAMRFVKDLEMVQVVLSGMNHKEQIKDNVSTFSDEQFLTVQEKDAIEQVSEMIQNEVGVLCTGCKYCMDHCPKKLEIPYFLKLYNEYKLSGKWRLSRLKATPKDKLPSACIECKQCTKQCPQGIEVYNYLKEMAKDYEEI